MQPEVRCSISVNVLGICMCTEAFHHQLGLGFLRCCEGEKSEFAIAPLTLCWIMMQILSAIHEFVSPLSRMPSVA